MKAGHESLVMSYGKEKGFKQLEVWKLSMRLTSRIYDVTEEFPNSQKNVLAPQMQRSALSIPSNIAEGSARAGKKEFIQFLYIAKASLAELETQVILAYARKYIVKQDYLELLPLMDSLNKMLRKLIESQKTEKIIP